MKISDEIVEKAAKVISHEFFANNGEIELSYNAKHVTRLALTAVLPDIEKAIVERCAQRAGHAPIRGTKPMPEHDKESWLAGFANACEAANRDIPDFIRALPPSTQQETKP